MARIGKLIRTHTTSVPILLGMCGAGFIADLHGESQRSILPLGLTALSRLAHRGAVDADGRTGDGAGVMTSQTTVAYP